MKILAPFSKKGEVLPLIDSGADELYCGIIPHEWENKYSMFDTLNRREGYTGELGVKNKKLKFITSYDVKYGGHGCVLKYKERIFDNRGKKVTKCPISIKRNTKQNKKGWRDCGACAMFDFNRIGITALKIVERGMPIESKIRDTQFIRKVLDILNKEKNLSRERFIVKTQELYCYAYKCDECSGFSCYYPSVFL